jgi:hypothetical protein
MTDIGKPLAELIAEMRAGLEGVTPGPWTTEPMDMRDQTIDRPYVVGPSEIVVGNDGICEPDKLNDRSFVEDAANMRHIARCSPDNIARLLDAANSYPLLVEALTKAAIALDVPSHKRDDTEFLRATVTIAGSIIRRALAQDTRS